MKKGEKRVVLLFRCYAEVHNLPVHIGHDLHVNISDDTLEYDDYPEDHGHPITTTRFPVHIFTSSDKIRCRQFRTARYIIEFSNARHKTASTGGVTHWSVAKCFFSGWQCSPLSSTSFIVFLLSLPPEEDVLSAREVRYSLHRSTFQCSQHYRRPLLRVALHRRCTGNTRILLSHSILHERILD